MTKNNSKQVVIPFKPRLWQETVFLNMLRFSVLVVHRRGGKTIVAVMKIIDAALRSKHKDSRWAYIAPFKTQARQIAWDYFKHFLADVPGVSFQEQALVINLPNGGRITLYGADNPDAMRGIYLDGCVMDEMADMRPQTWGEIIRPALADRKGWALFIGTPKGINIFSELYYHAVDDPEWYACRLTVNDTDALDPDELRQARDTMTDNQYRQEFLCDFSASTDNTLIPVDYVEDASRMTPPALADLSGLPRIIGVDVARFGGDRSCIQKRVGPVAFEPIVLRDVDNMQLVGRISTVIQDFRPDAVFIDGGRGEGVIDRLRQLNFDVMEVQFGGKASSHRYTNKRTEMWDLMADWVKQGGSIPNDTEFKADLCVPAYRFDSSNRMCLESKDEIKKRGMKSPDIADALALTFAAPVEPADNGFDERFTYNVNSFAKGAGADFDPYQ